MENEPDYINGYHIQGFKYNPLRSLTYLKGGMFIYDLLEDTELESTTIETELSDIQGEKIVEALEKVLLKCWSNSYLLFIFLKGDLFETNFWNKVQDIDNLSLYFNTKLDIKNNLEFSKYLTSTNIFHWT
jgi:hypothetical protein